MTYVDCPKCGVRCVKGNKFTWCPDMFAIEKLVGDVKAAELMRRASGYRPRTKKQQERALLSELMRIARTPA